MIYKDYKRNHVILPGREKALEAFLKQDYKGMQHKWENGFNSNSEDALTWSCFDLLSNLPLTKKIFVLDEIFEDAYQGNSKFLFRNGRLKKIKSKYISVNNTPVFLLKKQPKWMQVLNCQEN